MVAKGDVQESFTKSASKKLFVKKVFASVWDFAETFKRYIPLAFSRLNTGWLILSASGQYLAGCAHESHGCPVLLCSNKSAMKAVDPVLARGVCNSLIESTRLAVLLDGKDSIAASSGCVVVSANCGSVYAEVTSSAGIAVVLHRPYSGGDCFVHACVKGVIGSTFVFLRANYPPVIVKVDNKKILAGKYYYLGSGGKIELEPERD